MTLFHFYTLWLVIDHLDKCCYVNIVTFFICKGMGREGEQEREKEINFSSVAAFPK